MRASLFVSLLALGACLRSHDMMLDEDPPPVPGDPEPVPADPVTPDPGDPAEDPTAPEPDPIDPVEPGDCERAEETQLEIDVTPLLATTAARCRELTESGFDSSHVLRLLETSRDPSTGSIYLNVEGPMTGDLDACYVAIRGLGSDTWGELGDLEFPLMFEIHIERGEPTQITIAEYLECPSCLVDVRMPMFFAYDGPVYDGAIELAPDLNSGLAGYVYRGEATCATADYALHQLVTHDGTDDDAPQQFSEGEGPVAYYGSGGTRDLSYTVEAFRTVERECAETGICTPSEYFFAAWWPRAFINLPAED